jgi:hypothetical protein
MTTPKTNTAKTTITWLAGAPAVMVMASELTDLRFWWVQAIAAAVVLALMAWHGLLKPTKYDRHGYAIER